MKKRKVRTINGKIKELCGQYHRQHNRHAFHSYICESVRGKLVDRTMNRMLKNSIFRMKGSLLIMTWISIIYSERRMEIQWKLITNIVIFNFWLRFIFHRHNLIEMNSILSNRRIYSEKIIMLKLKIIKLKNIKFKEMVFCTGQTFQEHFSSVLSICVNLSLSF